MGESIFDENIMGKHRRSYYNYSNGTNKRALQGLHPASQSFRHLSSSRSNIRRVSGPINKNRRRSSQHVRSRNQMSQIKQLHRSFSAQSSFLRRRQSDSSGFSNGTADNTDSNNIDGSDNARGNSRFRSSVRKVRKSIRNNRREQVRRRLRKRKENKNAASDTKRK